ncbi:uncharacterized protein LOC100891729 [Strongylocentrotus purpuratus]|uniref:RUN domain-containing protein n=1 Tax=Strongylocentrotus purpuratus TaxID=7668 RepID=A0A7M7NQR9_STRPU|nr:uncharacterized protein LOC100891729 [Strongylocentrotus purpuratus]
MSIKDPLLTDLKGILLKLKAVTRPVDDAHQETLQLFTTIEDIFKKGLKSVNTVFGLSKKDYWNWIEQIEQHFKHGRPSAKFSHMLDAVRKSKKVKTNLGRGRLFIRLALNQGLLGIPIEVITSNTRLLETCYDPLESIIGSELLVESLSSLLFWASEIKFDLNIKNSSFLDETWLIPIYRPFELVPSESLGVVVRHIWDRIIVAEVKPGSVAADENKIEPGDVMDELYGESLYATVRGKIPSLLKDHIGWPISLAIVKCHLPTGKVYPPLKARFDKMAVEYPSFVAPQDRHANGDWSGSIQGLRPGEDEEPPMESISGSSFHKVQYIGKVSTGENGGTEVIQDAVLKVLNDATNVRKDVVVELGETLVIIYDQDTKEELMKHCFPEIASCGRRMDYVKCFAFVIGDTTCSISRQFSCHLFEAKTEIEVSQNLFSPSDLT